MRTFYSTFSDKERSRIVITDDLDCLPDEAWHRVITHYNKTLYTVHLDAGTLERYGFHVCVNTFDCFYETEEENDNNS